MVTGDDTQEQNDDLQNKSAAVSVETSYMMFRGNSNRMTCNTSSHVVLTVKKEETGQRDVMTFCKLDKYVPKVLPQY